MSIFSETTLCCIPVKKVAVLLAIIGSFAAGLVLITSIDTLASTPQPDFAGIDLDDNEQVLKTLQAMYWTTIHGVIIVAALIKIALDSGILVGSVSGRSEFMTPWILVHFAILVAATIAYIAYGVKEGINENNWKIMAGIGSAIYFGGYLWFVVLSACVTISMI